jgi:hypothetical protein
VTARTGCPTPEKHAHPSQSGAWAAFRSFARAQDGLLGNDWNVYYCVCGAWHIGHKRGSLADRARRAFRVNRSNRRRSRQR